MDVLDYHLIKCPHCNVDICVQKNEINCTIFRCGWLKSNWVQVDSHATQDVCDAYVKNALIYGCGKPFKFDGKSLTTCGYI